MSARGKGGGRVPMPSLPGLWILTPRDGGRHSREQYSHSISEGTNAMVGSFFGSTDTPSHRWLGMVCDGLVEE